LKGELDSTKNFVNGALNGPALIFYGSNETKSKISNVNEKLFGEITNYNLKVKKLFFHKNGELKSSMAYVNDKLHGEKIEYFPDGSFKSLYTFSNGVKNGPFTDWNETGFKKQKGTYVNDKLDGTYFRWFNHGEYSSITTYKDGVIHGVMRYYSPTGVITSEEYYFFGKLKFRFDYHDNGFLKQIQIFKSDSVVFQKNWNKLGLDITDDEFKFGLREVKELFPSGNLQTEQTYKNDILHGLSRHFGEDHALISLSLYYKGQHMFIRKTDENNEFIDTLFPDSPSQTVVHIEEDEN
jgi:antitoxin component YwqK of YwqJK toxin-antitoxin module